MEIVFGVIALYLWLSIRRAIKYINAIRELIQGQIHGIANQADIEIANINRRLLELEQKHFYDEDEE